MENCTQQKTPFLRLIIVASIILFTSLPAIILVNAGLIQFAIIKLVGPQNVTAMYSLAAGISGVAIVVLNPIGGALADKTRFKFGRRKTWIVGGSILGALSMVMLAYAPSIPVLIVAYILMQFFYGMVFLSCYAMVPEQVDPSKFGKISGIFGAAGPLGIMVGFMLVGAYAEVPVEKKLIIIAAVQLVVSLVSVLFLKDSCYQGNNLNTQDKNIVKGLKTFYPSIKKYPNFTWALLTKLLMAMANSSLNILTLYYIARFQLGEVEIMKLNATTSSAILLMVGSGIFGGFLSDKFKKQKIFVIGSALLSGACLVGFGITHSIPFVIAAYFMFNFVYGIFGAVDNALVNRVLPSKEDAGKDIAIINTTTQLGSAIVNFATPVVLSLGISLMGGDGYAVYFFILAATTVLAALTVLPIPEIGKPVCDNNEEIVTE
ncbi:MFS transporter [Clostridium saccharoperbutylacetonicum]|uniref:MFS transporter n=1 Tax=Clostridium saccharoperbutylacetonicum TaxID=36745 RepID=UPI000983D735|nr:MFS transporter [Clostridium saccharoperbutylacetonicum]AQR96721.1 major facilitator superfamily protein [Clostridium saccharoperbutylacetonicum]NSB32598.1 MFS family permease [Clostridium saccharoperbutylacetonicum]